MANGALVLIGLLVLPLFAVDASDARGAGCASLAVLPEPPLDVTLEPDESLGFRLQYRQPFSCAGGVQPSCPPSLGRSARFNVVPPSFAHAWFQGDPPNRSVDRPLEPDTSQSAWVATADLRVTARHIVEARTEEDLEIVAGPCEGPSANVSFPIRFATILDLNISVTSGRDKDRGVWDVTVRNDGNAVVRVGADLYEASPQGTKRTPNVFEMRLGSAWNKTLPMNGTTRVTVDRPERLDSLRLVVNAADVRHPRGWEFSRSVPLVVAEPEERRPPVLLMILGVLVGGAMVAWMLAAKQPRTPIPVAVDEG